MIKYFKEYNVDFLGVYYDEATKHSYCYFEISKWDKNVMLKCNTVYGIYNTSIDDILHTEILEELLNLPKNSKFKLKTNIVII